MFPTTPGLQHFCWLYRASHPFSTSPRLLSLDQHGGDTKLRLLSMCTPALQANFSSSLMTSSTNKKKSHRADKTPPNRRLRRRKILLSAPLQRRLLHALLHHHHRHRLQDPDHRTGREEGQVADMGYGRAGKVQDDYYGLLSRRDGDIARLRRHG